MKTFTITNVDGTLHDEFEVIVGLDRTFEITLAEDGSNDPTKVVQLFDDAPTHAVPTARRVRELERDVRFLKRELKGLSDELGYYRDTASTISLALPTITFEEWKKQQESE